MDKNLNLKFNRALINKAKLNNNTLPLTIAKNSDHKICIPKDITIGTSEVISKDSYTINEITLTARSNDIKKEAQEILHKRSTLLIPTIP